MIEYHKSSDVEIANPHVRLSKMHLVRRWEHALSCYRLDGSLWKVVLTSMDLNDCLELEKFREYKTAEVHVYLSKDVYLQAVREGLATVKEEKSKHELIIEYTNSLQNILVTKSAQKELYAATKGNIEDARAILEEVQYVYEDVYEITAKHIQGTVVRQTTVYATDVVYSALLEYNIHVPKKGNSLSGFKWRNWETLLAYLTEQVGKRMAYLSIRSTCKKLLASKLKYLDGKEITRREHDICKVVDVYEIIYLLNEVQEATEDSVYGAFVRLEQRRSKC